MLKLLASTKSKLTNVENGENVPHLEISEAVLVQDSVLLYTSVPNKSFGQLLDISPENFIFLKILIQIFDILKYGLQIKILNC